MVAVRPVASTERGSSGFDESRHGMLDLDLLEDAYYEVDIGGRMLRFNPAASEILGYPPTELVGKHYREYMPPAFAEKVKDLFSEVYETGRPSRSSEWVMVRPDGTSRRVEGSVALVRDPEGEPVGFCGIIRDVTERRRAEQALRESEERFRALTSLSTDWYWEQDADYRMVRFEGRRALLRYDPAKIVIGQRLWELPRMLLDEANWDEHRAQLEARETFRDFEYAYMSSSGKRYYVSISGAPIFDATGRFTGYRGTSRDVTRAKREQRLLELEHRVTHALSTPAGEDEVLATVIAAIARSEGWDTGAYFEFCHRTGAARLQVSYCDPGVPAATAEQHRARIGSIISKPIVLAQAARSGETSWIADVADALTPGSAWREFLMHTGERTLFIVPVQGEGRTRGAFTFASRSMREPDERLQRAMRVVADQVAQFLGRKAAERILRESEARFRALTHLSTDWYWELDTALRFTRIGGARGDLARSQDGGAALGRHPWQVGLRMASGRSWQDVADAMRRGEPIRDIEVFRRDRRRAIAWYAISGEPTTDEAGSITGYRGIGRDITDRMLAEQRIQRMATHDSLTGLPNRAHFTEKLEHAIETEASPFAVLFIDLDGFKPVNDTLGHEAGDALLREIGARIRGCLRGDDVVGRLGGDEFIVLLRDIAAPREAGRIAEKIRLLVGQPLRMHGHTLGVTPSIGIAIHPDSAGTAAGLLRAADLAMYEAKRSGKDRHAFFADLQPGGAAPAEPGRPNRGWAPV